MNFSFKKIYELSVTGFLVASLTYVSDAMAESPYAGMDKDEAGIWYFMRKVEEKVKTSGQRINNPQLIEYVEGVTCKVIGDACKDVRLYIMNAPAFNASMAPNGMMVVNSGLLLRAENEAQLGCVIGHEYGHFENKHSLKRWRAAKGWGNANLFLPIAGALMGMAALQSYSRDHEREADLIGFEKIAKNGYDSVQCSLIWNALIDEQQASSFKKIRKRGAKTANGIFSSHPVPKERAETLKELSIRYSGGEYSGWEQHRSAVETFLEQWLQSELLAKDFDRHIFLFEQLKKRGHNVAVLDYYIAEAYRLRRADGDKDLAFTYWKASSEGASPPPQVWRSLGEYYRRKKETEKALEAYQTYLEQQPGARDIALIKNYITRLSMEN